MTTPTKVSDRGSIANLTTTDPTVVTVTGNTTVNNYMIARVAVDNSGASGARPGLAVTDSRSNTWTVGTGGLADPGAANAGSACYIAYAKITVQLITNDTVSFDFTTVSGFAKSIIIEEWSGIHPSSPIAIAEVQASGSTTAFTISASPTAADQLLYAVCSVEGPTGDTFPSDADVTALTRLSTADATAANNQTNNGAYKVATGSSTVTWNGTLGTTRDWAAAAVVFASATTYSAISTLVDPFDTLDTSKWTFSDDAVADAGRLRLQPDTLYDNDAASVSRFSLVGSSIFVDVAQVLTASGTDTDLYLFTDEPSSGNNAVRFNVEDGTFTFILRTNGSNSNTSTTYNATSHRWWRFSESAGNVLFETSPDCRTWTTQRTVTPVFSVDSCQVVFITGYFGANPGAVFAYFDSLNIAPTEAFVTITPQGRRPVMRALRTR